MTKDEGNPNDKSGKGEIRRDLVSKPRRRVLRLFFVFWFFSREWLRLTGGRIPSTFVEAAH
jgi:hypothetical protein